MGNRGQLRHPPRSSPATPERGTLLWSNRDHYRLGFTALRYVADDANAGGRRPASAHRSGTQAGHRQSPRLLRMGADQTFAQGSDAYRRSRRKGGESDFSASSFASARQELQADFHGATAPRGTRLAR